jgi:hypothetical protein
VLVWFEEILKTQEHENANEIEMYVQTKDSNTPIF